MTCENGREEQRQRIYDNAGELAEAALCKKQCLCPDWKAAGMCCSCEVFLGLRQYYYETLTNNKDK